MASTQGTPIGVCWRSTISRAERRHNRAFIRNYLRRKLCLGLIISILFSNIFDQYAWNSFRIFQLLELFSYNSEATNEFTYLLQMQCSDMTFTETKSFPWIGLIDSSSNDNVSRVIATQTIEMEQICFDHARSAYEYYRLIIYKLWSVREVLREFGSRMLVQNWRLGLYKKSFYHPIISSVLSFLEKYIFLFSFSIFFPNLLLRYLVCHTTTRERTKKITICKFCFSFIDYIEKYAFNNNGHFEKNLEQENVTRKGAESIETKYFYNMIESILRKNFNVVKIPIKKHALSLRYCALM